MIKHSFIFLEGQYQCGPCPVAAVKRGDVFLNYDAKFIFAEVNGDKVTWMMNAILDPKVVTSVSLGDT